MRQANKPAEKNDKDNSHEGRFLLKAGDQIRFLDHCVAKGEIKARVHYSIDNRTDGRKCVTLYAKDYSRDLGKVLSGIYINETETMTDYFDPGRAVLFDDHPLYPAALARAKSVAAKWDAKWDAKWAAKRAGK